MDKLVDVVISETDTFWIFDLPPVVMSHDSEEAQQQLKRNAAYKALLSSRLGNDRYMERGMNTLNCPVIPKSVQTNRIITFEKSAMATVWDMADTFQEEVQDADKLDSKQPETVAEQDKSPFTGPTEVLEDGGPAEPISRSAVLRNFSVVADAVPGSATVVSDTTMLGNSITPIMNPPALERSDTDPSSVGTRIPGITTVATLDENSAGHAATTSTKLAAGATLVLGNGAQNESGGGTSVGGGGSTSGGAGGGGGGGSATKASSAMAGRGSDMLTRNDRTALNPDTVLLWRYQCSMTKGRNISDMAWNREDPNILAVGYGQYEFENQRKGLVGMFSGVIYVFDVRKNTPEPVIDTTHAAGRHFGAVRKLLWVVRESGRAESLSEVLVSVSTDGRVTEWFVRKGFDSTGKRL
ncbi:unnamed protein product [Echinostoma caproni]|uniref:WD_REPEATS_REGION domain-containing protein n=1 Tax=Echinostoma caproni TaxID=27848 RepID=A0A3P8KRQ9_9TREM|nr:unnamed protein product [Echinostoma caproni]